MRPFWSCLKGTETSGLVCHHSRWQKNKPSGSRFRFVSVLSVGLSFWGALSDSRDRFVAFELLFSVSVLFFTSVVGVWLADFLSIDGAGLESSSRMTHGGEGGRAEANFSGSSTTAGASFPDVSSVGESWMTDSVDWGAPKYSKKMSTKKQQCFRNLLRSGRS